MASHRLPRFKRSPKIAPIQLSERDLIIIGLVHRHRFLRSSHIADLVGGSAQTLLRRLQLLYHHGYLERPLTQIEYYRQGGSRAIAYGLGNKGASLLKQKLGPQFQGIRWGEKNRAVGRVFLQHALLVSDVMVSLEIACRKKGDACLLAEDDIVLPAGCRRPRPFKWRVEISKSLTLGVIPDRVFALDLDDESGDRKPAYFFFEADRGTMPIVRKDLRQTSFYRKLLAYQATWAKDVHRRQFGFHRFRVLTVATSAARVNSLVEACSRLNSGHGLFLFTDRATLENHGDIFTLPWKTGRPGETATLLPEAAKDHAYQEPRLQG